VDTAANSVAADFDTPLYVWVNRSTASSAEVLAAALKVSPGNALTAASVELCST
jgi:C-terminal processing protease CtpA/Prc